jgi:hypothetical protein
VVRASQTICYGSISRVFLEDHNQAADQIGEETGGKEWVEEVPRIVREVQGDKAQSGDYPKAEETDSKGFMGSEAKRSQRGRHGKLWGFVPNMPGEGE